MLSLNDIRMRMDAKTEANGQFSFKIFSDHKYVLQILRIFESENNMILELNNKIENRDKLLSYFFSYFTKMLNISSTSELNLKKPTDKDYSFLTTLIDADIIKWFIKDYMNSNVDLRIEIIDTINATVNDVINLRELLIIQFEEDKKISNKK